jgi:hypothetical protein
MPSGVHDREMSNGEVAEWLGMTRRGSVSGRPIPGSRSRKPPFTLTDEAMSSPRSTK